MEDKQYDPNIRPADRLADVNEYYFSRKLKERALAICEDRTALRVLAMTM